MLEISVYTGKWVEIPLKNITAITLDRSVAAPADDITLIVPFNRAIGDIRYIKVIDGSFVIFNGIIDSVENIISQSGKYLKICGRSLCALLIDNEANPINYSVISTQIIFDTYFKPFGFTRFCGENRHLSENLNVEKGMSCFQAAQNFCTRCYGDILYFDSDSSVYFGTTPYSEIITFSNITKGHRYIYINEKCDNSVLISNVNVKTGTDPAYDLKLLNETALEKGITAVRYFDAGDNTGNEVSTAQKLISDSLNAYKTVKIICPSRFIPPLLSPAKVIDDSIGVAENLYIKRIYYTFSSGEEKTTFEMGRRSD